ncbi:protein of unknown function [Nitrospira defluvii]|uniref:Uncharacterized protein n=1 Tax=Nitrospira defluvii TaxID=330214 RepID=D8PDQ5_9BACT|nr:protein of unknown function [Nitrospira defluvii]
MYRWPFTRSQAYGINGLRRKSQIVGGRIHLNPNVRHDRHDAAGFAYRVMSARWRG